MILKDWREIEEYAKDRCKKVSEETGEVIQYETYKSYCNKRGIAILLYNDGEIFKKLYSGIYDEVMEVKRSIDEQIKRIKKEIG